MEFVVYPGLIHKVLPRILFEQVWLPMDAGRRRLDVLHYPGTAGSFWIRATDVVTVHHDSVTNRMSMSQVKNTYFDAALLINRRAGRIIAPSQVYAEQLVRYFGYRPEKVRPVHHGVSSSFRNVTESEVAQIRRQYGIEQNAILTVTNTRPHKNNGNLLRAYNLLLMQYHLDNQLIMVGNIDEVVLRQLVYESTNDPEHVSSRLRVIPFLPHEQLPPIYAAAAVFVTLSQIESFGMPLVEAMASGLPVVASDIPIHREILQGAGVLVSPDAPDALALSLHRLLTDATYRNLLGQSAQRRSADFSWEKTARQTLEVYEDAWASAQRGS